MALRSHKLRVEFRRVLANLGERTGCPECQEEVFAVPLYRLRGLDDLHASACPRCGHLVRSYFLPRGKDVQSVLNTAFLDLDIHFGTGALSLDLEPGRGLTDAIENPSRIDGLFIERAMVRANERLSVLSAEAPINQPLMTDGTAYFQLQEEMKNAFESTVVDLPRHMLIQYPHMVHDAHVAVVVSELTLAATRDTIRILAWLKSNAPQTKVIVVSNRVPSGGALEISKKDFEQSIERNIDILFPDEAKAAATTTSSARATQAGRPAPATSRASAKSTRRSVTPWATSCSSHPSRTTGRRPRRARGGGTNRSTPRIRRDRQRRRGSPVDALHRAG